MGAEPSSPEVIDLGVSREDGLVFYMELGTRFRRPRTGRLFCPGCASRNVAFTYFEEALQLEVLARLAAVLRPGGALVLGLHERLPGARGFGAWDDLRSIYRRGDV